MLRTRMELRALKHASANETVSVAPEGEAPKQFGSAFYRGENCNFNPYTADHLAKDFVSRYILKGWLPTEPFIAPETRITAFGSCFAENVSQYLMALGFDLSKKRAEEIYVSSMGEGLVNVSSIVQQFRWALEGWAPPENLWHGYDAKVHGISEDVRLKTRDVFLETEVFILTFGLSEIWYDEVTGGVFWRAVPMHSFDSARHKFRVCTFAETKAHIGEILDLIARHIPRAKVIMTLSPIPLVATFRPNSCITSNAVSKALLRSALDETLREREGLNERYFYFPAYELVSECFPDRFASDGRHTQHMIVPAIMRIFEASYCRTALEMETAEAEFRAARIQNAALVQHHPLYSSATG